MDGTVTNGPVASRNPDELTDDAFLGGALQILQPRAGYRAGLDAVMLAAAVPTLDGQGAGDEPHPVLDVGAGVGTAGLCLARRAPAVHVTLLEKEVQLVHIAEENVRRNDLLARVSVVAGAVGVSAIEARGLGLSEESFAHVMANPPYHDADAGTPAPDALKAGAHAMVEGELDRWARFMARMAAPGGGMTIIHKAEALARLLAALEGRFGALKVLPLYPREGVAAHRVIVQGVKGSRGPLTLLPGFVLHAADGQFTPAAQDILRGGAALSMNVAS